MIWRALAERSGVSALDYDSQISDGSLSEAPIQSGVTAALCRRTPNHWLALGPVTGSRAHGDVFARSLHLNFPIRAVLILVLRVITKQVLRPQFSGNCGKGLRQGSDSVRTVKRAARAIGKVFQIAVGQQIKIIEHATDAVVSRRRRWLHGRITVAVGVSRPRIIARVITRVGIRKRIVRRRRSLRYLLSSENHVRIWQGQRAPWHLRHRRFITAGKGRRR